ncbi:hypothetical protein LY78DRAFT_672522 [Colletotrichum sublineola]|uniref:Uncharacterized protein n=1 Tax=Colletotrichum sublineola TaxID=1173701 RepID=A0A066XB05_COLSU|nr:hypothetical protein LY78DRAFT_672522 [Colletotrichum sublineola]KDN62946.1 hypothetical protein CSUB01_11485 [Colletotrichum sublineola]
MSPHTLERTDAEARDGHADITAPPALSGASKIAASQRLGDKDGLNHSEAAILLGSSDSTDNADGFPRLRLDTPEKLDFDLDARCQLQRHLAGFPAPTVSFHLASRHLHILERLLAERRVARFSYDFVTEHAYVVMMETTIHNQCNRGVGRLIEQAILDVAASVAAYGPRQGVEADVAARLSRRLRRVQSNGSVKVESRGRLRSEPDNQFIDRDASSSATPPFVVEVAYSQSLERAIDKANLYVQRTKGLIRTVLIVEVQYPQVSWVRLHLFAAGRAGVDLVTFEAQRLTLFDDTVQVTEAEPNAESESTAPLRLFASDFLSMDSHDIPASLRRPVPGQDHHSR